MGVFFLWGNHQFGKLAVDLDCRGRMFSGGNASHTALALKLARRPEVNWFRRSYRLCASARVWSY